MSKVNTVLTYGTFDLFHIGHVRLLERLAAMGERLIVGCSTDEFNLKKNKKAVIPYLERRAILEACRHVDLVIPERDWGQKVSDIHDFEVDMFAMGDDWAGHFDDLSLHCDVTYLDRTAGISSTLLKEKLANTRPSSDGGRATIDALKGRGVVAKPSKPNRYARDFQPAAFMYSQR